MKISRACGQRGQLHGSTSDKSTKKPQIPSQFIPTIVALSYSVIGRVPCRLWRATAFVDNLNITFPDILTGQSIFFPAKTHSIVNILYGYAFTSAGMENFLAGSSNQELFSDG
jgi:hypothetical protein